MAQRPFFWPRHGNTAASNDAAENAGRSVSPPRNTAAHSQHRLPPNSGASPSAGAGPGPSSFSSSHSSSPSPSPSINPYASAARSALLDVAKQGPSSAAHTQRASPTSTLPGNLRRTTSRAHSESAPVPVSSRLYEGASAAAATTTAAHQQMQAWHSGSGSRRPVSGAHAEPLASSVTSAHGQISTAAAAPTLHGSGRDTRCEQIVQNFYSKTAQVVAHLRGDGSGARNEAADAETGGSAMYASSASSSVADVGATGRRINKWFNMSLEDIADAKEEAKLWRHTVAAIALGQRQPLTPPPMVIEVCLDVSAVQPDDELQVADIYGRPWSVDLELAAPTPGPPGSQHFDDIFSAKGSSASSARGTHRMRATSIVLETWRLDLDARAIPQPAPDLPRVYKKAIVFFRSLYAFASLLPCASLTQTQQAGGDLLDRRQMPLFYTFRQDTMPRSGAIDLDVGLTGTERFLESHVFEPVATPMGTFSMSVQYRRESSFSCSTPNSIIAHDEYGPIGAADDTYFTPTLSSRSGSHFSAVRHQHQQQQRLHHQRTGDYVHLAAEHAGRRSLTIPSVNPFRARPVSVGHAASLGSGWRGSIGESMHVARSHDSNIRAASLSGSGGGTRIRAASASATGATPIRPHSLDQRAEAILGRLSTSAATDSGSMLHRSVMLRRLGDSLSPTDSHRSGDASLRFPATTVAAAAAAAAAVEATGHVPRSPPRPGVPGARTISSGASVTASAAGRSSLGITPFKSPSLSGSPASRFVSSFAEVSETMSPPRSTDHVAAARRLTIGGGTPVPASRGSSNISSSPSHAAGMQQLMTRISDSPSSLGSGHSRGLSSSFGNRRTNSLRNRQMSLLGTSAIDHQATDSPGAMRRRTVVGGLGWADADARDIDDFIRMVESKQPLKLVRKDQHHNASDPPLSAGPVLSSPYDAIAAASGEDTLRLFHGIYNDFSGMSRDMESSVAMGTSGDHDKRRSRDAPLSYALRHEPLTATPEEDAAVERSLLPQVAAASSSSSFRRPAMPNPLMAAERASLSRPVSIVAAGDAIPAPIPARSTEDEATQEARQQSATNIAEQPPPKAAGSSVDLLRIALSDLNIETGNHHSLKQTSSRTQGEEDYLGQKPASLATTGRMQSGLSIVGKPHVRSAAARLDPELGRPLPPPVPIPRSHSATGRHHESTSRRRVSRASVSSGDGEEGLGISLTPLHSMRQRPPSRERNRRPSADSTRGKSQPTARAHHDLGFAPAHRISTPQPPQLHTSPSVSSPYSHRGEFLSSNGQLDALLGLTDQIPAATSSRETPTTSQHGAMSPLFQTTSGTVGPSTTTTTASRRRRSTASQRGRPANVQALDDPVRSNFPPLSFIIPRNRVDGRPIDLVTHRQDAHFSDLTMRGATSSVEADNNSDDDEDDEYELMFQMETSSTTKR